MIRWYIRIVILFTKYIGMPEHIGPPGYETAVPQQKEQKRDDKITSMNILW